MKDFLTACGILLPILALCAYLAAYLGATDCPPGYVAVRGVYLWPVCVAGAPAP